VIRFSLDEQRQILREAFVNVCIATRDSTAPPKERALMLEELARRLTAGLNAVDRGDTTEVALTLCHFKIVASQDNR